MSDPTTDAKSAGTRFPFVNLEKAIARAQELFDADQKGREMTLAAAFGVWGYSEKSSGGFQTVAALKMYGLLKDSSAGDTRKVGLSEAALRYFRDEREEEKKSLARDFALMPKLIGALWLEWHASPPADTVARSHLKAERGLNDQSARSLLAIYKENLAFAELKPSDKLPKPEPKQRAAGDDTYRPFTPPEHHIPPPPVIQPRQEVKVMAGERELTAGLLSKDASFRLIVSGAIGVKEMERLIAKLEMDKEILAEDPDKDIRQELDQ